MRSISLITIGLMSLAAVSGAQSWLPFERSNDYAITFLDSQTFTGALFNGYIDNAWQGTAGQYSNYAYYTVPGELILSWTGTGAISVSNLDVTGSSVSSTIRDSGSFEGIGESSLHLTVAPNRSTFLTTGVYNGLHDLEFQSHSPGGVEEGGTYSYTLEFPGDWNLGTSSGNLDLVSFNYAGGWSLTNYYFDGVHTVLQFLNPSYIDDGNHDIDIDVLLLGGPSTVRTPQATSPGAARVGEDVCPIVGPRAASI